jgi:hypothetical protein
MKYHLTYTDNKPNDYSIVQGEYFSFTIYYPDFDFSTWFLQSHIRKTYDDPQILAAFSFQPTVYQLHTNTAGVSKLYSIIIPYLGASQTVLLPVTRSRKSELESAREGGNVWVYDLEAHHPTDSDNVIKIISKSYVEVIPEVTRS